MHIYKSLIAFSKSSFSLVALPLLLTAFLLLLVSSDTQASVSCDGRCEEPEPPRSSVGSCLIPDTTTFKVTFVNKGGPGSLGYDIYKSVDLVDLGHFESDQSKTIEINQEGTLRKFIYVDGKWKQKGGTHTLSVDGHTKHEYFCEVEEEPQSELNIDFAFDDRPCDNNFTARYTIEEDGEAITDLKVRFTYAGMVKEATTNSDGRAEVTFTNHGEDTLTAEPDKGYPKKEMTYVQGDNSHCEPSEDEGDDEGEVLGATDEGYTLGAYAPAGTFDQILMHSVGILGTTLTAAGATLHLKKRFNK